MARELEKGMTFLIRYNDLPDGTVSNDDSTFLNQVKALFEEKVGEEFEDKTIYKDGYEGREFFYVTVYLSGFKHFFEVTECIF